MVQSGDTLDSLAEQLGLERDLIMESNCLDAMVIVPGLTISLPPLGIVVDITPTVEITPTAELAATAVGTVVATATAASGPIAGVPSVTATPFIGPSATPAATSTGDQPDDLVTPPPRPTRRPTTCADRHDYSDGDSAGPAHGGRPDCYATGLARQRYANGDAPGSAGWRLSDSYTACAAVGLRALGHVCLIS